MQEENTIPELVDDLRAGKMPRRQFVQTLTKLGLSVAGIGAIVAAASRSNHAMGIHQAAEQKSPEKHLDLHEQHIKYQSQGDTDALHNDYAEHAMVEDSMYDSPFVGRAAIMSRKNMGIAATSDFNIQVNKRVASGNQVIVEWVATGKHTGDLPGLPASGRHFTLNGVTVVVRQHGKIVRESLYYDVADFRKQLSTV